MKICVFTIIMFVCCLSCNNSREDKPEDIKIKPESEMVFDKEKWRIKNGGDYPFRDKMLKDIVYNDTIRTLKKDEIINLLGEPSYYRENKNFLYYRITQKKLFFWTLHTKTMVVKLSEDETIDWIKIHK